MKRLFNQSILLFLISLPLAFSHRPTFAQSIVPDDTLGAESSIVTPQQLRDLIEGGAIRGENLFHSFREFNVLAGEQVFFANPDGIFNILTRITGVNPSDIFGTLGVDGAANLVLINPNGINFGADAILNVSGSFFATTAESVVFGDGLEFSATNPEAPPLLTVNIIPGLQNGTPPQAPINTAGALFVGEGQSLSFSATQINDTAFWFAPDGNITLEATADINFNGSSFITVNLLGTGAGDVSLTSGGNISFTNGASILTTPLNGQQGGNVSISANENITLDGTQINSLLGLPSGIFSGGNIDITTGSLFLNNGAQLITPALVEGDVGDVNINASGDVILQGESPTFGLPSGISSGVGEGVVGNTGNISINANSLTLTDGAEVTTATLGLGNAGDVSINAGSIELAGEASNGNRSSISSEVGSETVVALGNAGDINITTDSLAISDGGLVVASTYAFGNAGNITIVAETINADGESSGGISSGIFSEVQAGALGSAGEIDITTGTLSLTNGAQVVTNTSGFGDAGKVTIFADDSINLDGEGNFVSGIFSTVRSDALGNAGEIAITTGSLSLTNGSAIVASTSGFGDAGKITIFADDSINLDGRGNFVSGIYNTVESGALGDAGTIEINTGSLSLSNGAQLIANTRSLGNAGDITVNATENIFLDGEAADGSSTSGIFSEVKETGIGDAGSINITTGSLFVSNGAQVVASTRGEGNAGQVNIFADDSISLDGEGIFVSGIFSVVNSGALGNAGEITITTNSLSATNGAQIVASTQGEGDAGRINIFAEDSVSLDGEGNFVSGIFSTVDTTGIGNAGEIAVTTGSLSITNGAQVVTSTQGEGDAGRINIFAEDSVFIDGEGNFVSGIFSEVRTSAVGNAGDVRIEAGALSLTNGAVVAASTDGTGNAGRVTIVVDDSITFDGKDTFASGIFSSVLSNGIGNAGEVDITANSLSLTNGAIISNRSFGQGNAGSVNVTTNEDITVDGQSSDGQGSGIVSNVLAGAVGDGGSINLASGEVTISNGGFISAANEGQGNGGSVVINGEQVAVRGGSEVVVSSSSGQAGNLVMAATNLTLDEGTLSADTAAGDGGNINLQISDLLLLRRNSLISAEAQGEGNSGNIEINARSLVAIPSENSDIVASAEKGGNITITAENVLGIEFSESLTELSDITATGTVTFNTPNTDDPVQGIVNLPTDVIDAPSLIARTCAEDGGEQLSEFYVTGRGGLPPNPEEPLRRSGVLVDLVSLSGDGEIEQQRTNNEEQITNQQITEAQGWVKDADGGVRLTAQEQSNKLVIPWLAAYKCSI